MKEYLKTVLTFIIEKTRLSKSFLSQLSMLVQKIKIILPIPNISVKRLYLIQNLTAKIGF